MGTPYAFSAGSFNVNGSITAAMPTARYTAVRLNRRGGVGGNGLGTGAGGGMGGKDEG